MIEKTSFPVLAEKKKLKLCRQLNDNITYRHTLEVNSLYAYSQT